MSASSADTDSVLQKFVNVLGWFLSSSQNPPNVPNVIQNRQGSRSAQTQPSSNSSITRESRIKKKITDKPMITNLESLLSDILVRYIILKDEDFQLYFNVTETIFQNLHAKIKEVDPYYNRYSSTVQHAGSHYDNVRVYKPDEFDKVIVMALPACLNENPSNPNESDIKFEPRHAGYVQLKMGPQFQNLPMRDKDSWLINKTAYSWKDEAHFLLQNRFLDWFKSIVKKGLNKFEMQNGKPVFAVNGIKYTISHSQSGPAETLIITNASTDFYVSLDLVPALKFPETRWPITKQYRHIPPECRRQVWQVVGKPNKEAKNDVDQRRSWRISMQNQERMYMHGTNNLRNAVRLMKKLRDALEMHAFASYFIKTLFLFEIVRVNDKQYWSKNSPGKLFKIMVTRLYDTLVAGKLPYFWNEKHDLLWNISKSLLNSYAAKLKPLITILEQPERYKEVAKFLLSNKDYDDYNEKILSKL